MKPPNLPAIVYLGSDNRRLSGRPSHVLRSSLVLMLLCIGTPLIAATACFTAAPPRSSEESSREIPRKATTGDIERSKDRFTGRESILLTGMEVPICSPEKDEAQRRLVRGLRPVVAGCGNWDFLGHARPGEPEMRLAVIHMHPKWWWMECHNVDMLVDGKPMKPVEVNWDGTALGGQVSESVDMLFVRDDLERLVVAQSIEIRVCHSEMRFESENIKGLQMFIALIMQGVPTPESHTPTSDTETN